MTTATLETLQDIDLTEDSFGASKSAKWDPEHNMIRGVKVLGSISQNGRIYTPEAKKKAIADGLYEGCKVNINHPENPRKTRDLRDRFGRIVNPRLGPDGDIYGDLTYNPDHPEAKGIIWWAKNDPSGLGLSHNAVGRGKDDANGVFVVHEIVKVRGVDLVADPATTKTLYEATGMTSEDITKQIDEAVQAVKEGFEYQVGDIIKSILKDKSLDNPTRRRRVLIALRLLHPKASDEEVPGDEEGEETTTPEPKESEDMEPALKEAVEALKANTDPNVKVLLEAVQKKETPPAVTAAPAAAAAAPVVAATTAAPAVNEPAKDYNAARTLLESVLATKKANIAKTQKEVNQKKVVVTRQKVSGTVLKLCQEAALPQELITNHFLRTLTEAKDDTERKAMIDDRKLLMNPTASTSVSKKTEPKMKVGDVKAEDFAAKIRR